MQLPVLCIANSGELWCVFKFADNAGNRIHCVAYDRGAERDGLNNMHHILAYTHSRCPALGNVPHTVLLLKDAFTLPLGRRVVMLLLHQVL